MSVCSLLRVFKCKGFIEAGDESSCFRIVVYKMDVAFYRWTLNCSVDSVSVMYGNCLRGLKEGNVVVRGLVSRWYVCCK